MSLVELPFHSIALQLAMFIVFKIQLVKICRIARQASTTGGLRGQEVSR